MPEIAGLRFDPLLAGPKKRSLTIAGHKTSITLEDAFWSALKRIAAESGYTVASLVAAIDETRAPAGLSASIRVFILTHYEAKASMLSDAQEAVPDRLPSSR